MQNWLESYKNKAELNEGPDLFERISPHLNNDGSNQESRLKT